MSDRAGATPDGGAPDRFPQPAAAAEAGVGGPAEPAPVEKSRSDSDIAPQPARPDEFEYEVPFDTGQLQALPTGQLLRVHRPPVDLDEDEVEEETQRRVYSYVGAVFGVIGAVASLFVGWMLPLSIAGIVFGVLGLRREEHGRVPAFVGIGAGLVGLVFSAVWIGYYAIVFGALPR